MYGGVQYDVGYEGKYLYELQREYVVGGSEAGGMLDPEAGRDY